MIISNRLNLGGIQIKILDILSELNYGKNLEPILVLRKAEGEFLPQVPDQVKIIDLNLGESLFSGITMIIKLTRVINIYRPEKIVTFADHVSLLTIFSRFLSFHFNIPQIVNEGIYLSYYLEKQPFGSLRKILIRRFYPLVNKIVVLSKAQKKDLIQNFNVPEKKIKVINNWVSPIHFGIKTPGKAKILKKFDVIFVGRLEKQKNLFKFIEIINRLKKILPDLKAKIVGTGSRDNLLNQKVKKMRLSKTVFFTGYSVNPAKHYQSAKVFLLTSLFEGQPHSVLEAMWFGLPVVAIRSPGIEEIVSNNRTGYTVRNLDEAVDKLELLLKNTSLMKKIGRRAVLISHKRYGVKNLHKLVKLIN